MEYTHPVDRLVYRLRPVIILGAYASLPVFLISYGFMMHWLLTTAPIWASVLTVAAHLTCLLGIGSLIDMRSERQNSPQDGR